MFVSGGGDIGGGTVLTKTKEERPLGSQRQTQTHPTVVLRGQRGVQATSAQASRGDICLLGTRDSALTLQSEEKQSNYDTL